LDIVYKQLTLGKSTSRYPWTATGHFNDVLQSLLNRAYPSIEWGLNSPPKPHAFVSLPLQSSTGSTTVDAAIATVTALENHALEAMEQILDTLRESGQEVRDAIDSGAEEQTVEQMKLGMWDKADEYNEHVESLKEAALREGMDNNVNTSKIEDIEAFIPDADSDTE